MNNQQAFDQVWQYFLTERHPAGVDPDTGKCVYAGPCAIGVLVDPGYRKRYDLEGVTVGQIVRRNPDLFAEAAEAFLGLLQIAHDNAAGAGAQLFHRRLKLELVQLANRYELNVPPHV